MSRASGLRAAAWAARAGLLTRRQVRAHGLRRLAVPTSGAPGLQHEWTVERVLAVLRVRCLVRSLVLQRYLLDHGLRTEVVVGATSPRRGFSAHAWLAGGGRQEFDKGHVELLRIPPPVETS